MQRNYGLIAALSLVTAIPMAASAEEGGLYFSGWFGTASYDIKKSELDDLMLLAIDEANLGFVDGDSDLDKSDTALSALVGYRLNDYVALEAAYIDLGKANYDAQATVFVPGLGGGFADLDGGFDISSKGLALSGLGMWPVTEAFDLYARLGVFFSDTKFKFSFNGVSDSVSGKDQDFFYGLGAGWNIGTNWALRLEYQQFKDVGKKSKTGEGDVDTVSLGVLFRI